MESMIIQIGPRNSQPSNTIKCTGQVFNIGRSFQNDLVLSDPYIAPNQLRLRKKASGWFIDLLDTTNPVFINGKALKQSQATIGSGDWVTIGRTVLRFFADDHQVEPSRKLFFSNWYHLNRWQVLLAIGLLTVLISSFVMLSEYLQTWTEIEWQELLASVLLVQAVIVVWAMVWAIVGRVLRHQNQFFIQFAVTTAVFLLATVADLIFSPLAYMASSQVLGLVVDWGLTFVTFALLLYLNYSIATNLRKPLRSACIVSGLILLFIYCVYQLDKDSFQYDPEYMKELYPPMFKLRRDISTETYLNRYDDLFNSIEIEDS